MTARSLRNIETRKKKSRRKAERPKTTRSTGNSARGRHAAKKAANIERGRAQAETQAHAET